MGGPSLYYRNLSFAHPRTNAVHNGSLPEREIITAVGPVSIQVPKVRDHSGSGVKFNSSIAPPYVRKSPRVSGSRFIRQNRTGRHASLRSPPIGLAC